MRRAFVTCLLFVCFLPPLPSQVPAQRRGAAQEPMEEKWERDRKKSMNKERQADLKKDTDRLLQLATELKQYVDKTNENMLSLEVLKKTDEIEKLSKRIRDKMKADNLMPGPEFSK
jgi:hypothetical protein